MIRNLDGRSRTRTSDGQSRHRVVIVGGGFGGLYAAKALRRAPVDVTLVDRRNFHLFQPLLYQVATGALSPGDIASPLRAVLRRQRNATVLLGDVRGIDPEGRRLMLADGAELEYDSLVVATGARHAYFGRDEWEPLAPGLKTLEEALEIRRRVLIAFEAAEREADRDAAQAWLTFVVAGAGPTGVELAGALGEIANETLPGDFRRIDPREARILLLELVDRVLPSYPPRLSERAARSLARLGVTVRTGTRVTAIDDEAVTVEHEGRTERIPARTVLWAAGVRASSLGRVLAEATGAELDRAGRVLVAPDLSLPGHPEIFVIGDLATLVDERGRQVPGVAPAAMQEGKFVANLIRRRLEGEPVVGSSHRFEGEPGARPDRRLEGQPAGTSDRRLEGQPAATFRYHDKGSLATIGRGAGVADLGRLRFGGFIAWLAWLFVHLFYLVEFENRIVVLMRWTWNFFTRQRASRLITGHILQPPIEQRPLAAVDASGAGIPGPADPVGDGTTTRSDVSGAGARAPSDAVGSGTPVAPDAAGRDARLADAAGGTTPAPSDPAAGGAPAPRDPAGGEVPAFAGAPRDAPGVGTSLAGPADATIVETGPDSRTADGHVTR